MGNLSEFLSSTPGYFRAGEEDNFPWESTSKIVWYALLNVEETEIERYGFTSALSQKSELLKALKKVKSKSKAMLLGIWTGNHRTDLFVLDKQKAIEHLNRVLSDA